MLNDLLQLIISFAGSFLCFVLWVHYDFDHRWRDRRALHKLREIERGKELENEQRIRRGLPPL